MTADRSRRGELQHIVGSRGTVFPFVSLPTLDRTALGWYLEPSSPSESCECFVCQAARKEQPAFIATSSFLAVQVLTDYANAHPAPEQEATG